MKIKIALIVVAVCYIWLGIIMFYIALKKDPPKKHTITLYTPEGVDSNATKEGDPVVVWSAYEIETEYVTQFEYDTINTKPNTIYIIIQEQ